MASIYSVFYELDIGVRYILSDTVLKHPNNLMMLELLASTPFPDQKKEWGKKDTASMIYEMTEQSPNWVFCLKAQAFC